LKFGRIWISAPQEGTGGMRGGHFEFLGGQKINNHIKKTKAHSGLLFLTNILEIKQLVKFEGF